MAEMLPGAVLCCSKMVVVVVKAVHAHACLGGGEGGERDATAKDCTCMRCSPPLPLPSSPIYGGGGGRELGSGGSRRGRDDETYVPDSRPLLPQGDSLRRGAVPSLLVGDFHSVPLVIIRLKKIKKIKKIGLRSSLFTSCPGNSAAVVVVVVEGWRLP